jgi:uncharacterized delta-60 repeat protein
MLRKTLIAASAAAFLAVPAAAQAAPGDLDPTFGGGTVLDPLSFIANDVVATADGGAVIASEQGMLLKLRADGTRDPSFSGDGVVSLGLSSNVRALALDGQGRILAADDERVARVRPDGALDPTWGSESDGHLVTVALGDDADATAITALAAAPDGTILVAGRYDDGFIDRPSVARLTAGGSPDPSFSGDGRQIFGPIVDAQATDVLPDGTGGMYLLGEARPNSFVVHLDRQGFGDTAFGTSGQVDLHLGAPDENTLLRRLTLTTDGRLVAAGLWTDATALDGDGLVASLSALDGTPTAGFGDGGLQTIDLDPEGFDELYDVAASVDGDVVVGGAVGVVGDRDAIVARVRGTDGSLDDGFGTGGLVRHHRTTGGAVIRGLVRDRTGAITATGTSRDTILALRIADRGSRPGPQPDDGTPDTGTPDGGTAAGGDALVPPAVAADTPPAVVAQDDAPSQTPVVVAQGRPPAHRPAAWFHRLRSTLRLRGEADQGAARVQVAITRRDGKRCAAVTSTRRARLTTPKACRSTTTRWLAARITPRTGRTTAWTLRLRARLPAGRYTATVRALDIEEIAGTTSEVTFRVR